MKANNSRYFINGKEVTANRYAAMKRLNNYMGRKSAEAFARGDMDGVNTRAAWFTYEAAADAEYGIARYIDDCRRLGYLNEETETPTDNIPATMNAHETANALELLAVLPATAVRVAAGALIPAKYFDEYFTPETANVEYLRSMLEDYVLEHDITAAQFSEVASRRPRIFKTQTV